VFCRNVMIYFDKPTQYQVLQRIAPLLGAGGLLYAGHSESFSHAQDLVVPCGRTTYRATHQAGHP
jgi:chemotaxis protein methyltransferase CheR